PKRLAVHEAWGRGFCARPGWCHTYEKANARQGHDPGRHLRSSGTLHANGFGHFYAALRVLTQLRADYHIVGHNLDLLSPLDFDPRVTDLERADKGEGFASYLQNMHETGEALRDYYKF